MQVFVLPISQLNDEELAAWSRIQASQATLESPYFRPEFSQLVDSVCGDVEVAVFREKNETVGFFPFQKNRRNVARPVGGAMNDFHGPIWAEGVKLSPRQFLKESKLSAFRFDHLVAPQPDWNRYQLVVAESPYIDLPGSHEDYVKEKNGSGSKVVKQMARFRRKIAREVGEVRIEVGMVDDGRVDTLIRWKSEQYHESGVPDVFAYRWTGQLLRAVLNENTPGFSGYLASMFAGDDLVAMHAGLLSGGVLHSWFPAYRQKFANYSVGNVLILEMIEHAAQNGIRRIHLGKGPEAYKWRFQNGTVPVGIGSVERDPLVQLARKACHETCQKIRESSYHALARTVSRRVLRPVRGWMAFG